MTQEKEPKSGAKIMDKPLPAILDELEADLRSEIERAKLATREAKEAAAEARKAGEKAVAEVAKVAQAEVAKVAGQVAELKKKTQERIEDIRDAINDLSSKLEQVRAVADTALALSLRLAKAVPAGLEAHIGAFNQAIQPEAEKEPEAQKETKTKIPEGTITS